MVVRKSAPQSRSTFSILVIAPSGTTVVPMPVDGRLRIGRGVDCDLRIDDSKLSRVHAELHASGTELRILDRGSRNGTFFRGKRLAADEPMAIDEGDSVLLGATTLVVQRAPASEERSRRIWTHAYFESAVAEECARAEAEGAAFAIVRLRTAAGSTNATTTDLPTRAVAHLLERAAVVAACGPHDQEMLLAQTTVEEAEAFVAAMRAELDDSGLDYAIGLACYPRDGRTAAMLVDHARLRRAREAASSMAMHIVARSIEKLDLVVDRVVVSDLTILVLGETGVGKEVLIRRIHARSPRATKPLVLVDCTELAESLLETELFGYEKGAVAGADVAKAGLLEAADGGSVFFDEIGELPASLQGKLLRVLEKRETRRLGARQATALDVRFLAATNRDLVHDVTAGRFRRDLFYRLSGIVLKLPPLRERRAEIEWLASAFAEHIAIASRRPTPRFSSNAVRALQAHDWPGNVRELRQVVDRAMLLTSSDTIEVEHFHLPSAATTTFADAESTTRSSASVPPAKDDERSRVVDALARSGGNQRKAAKLLGISRGTMAKRIADYRIPRPRKPH